MFKRPSHTLKIFITASILAWCSFTVYAQEERITYSEDTTENINQYDRYYQLTSEQKRDVNTLLKFDAVQWGQVHPSLTIEQRIWKNLTVEPSITFSSLAWSSELGINFAFNPNVSLKYYFNKKRRERLGKNVIGFSGDYISVNFSYSVTDDKNFFEYELGDNFLNLEDGDELTADFYNYASWNIMYGIQRKFGKLAYADISGGIQRSYFGDYGISKVLPVIKLRLGFALSIEQFKRFSR
jgi:hypothetical protein